MLIGCVGCRNNRNAVVAGAINGISNGSTQGVEIADRGLAQRAAHSQFLAAVVINVGYDLLRRAARRGRPGALFDAAQTIVGCGDDGAGGVRGGDQISAAVKYFRLSVASIATESSRDLAVGVIIKGLP